MEREFGRQCRLEVAQTGHPGHARELAREAADERFDAVVALGGDGTLNEAANGLANRGIPLGALPGGSTNVFARSLGVPADLASAGRLLAHAVTEGRHQQISLGRVANRYFLFHLGIGFDARVVALVERFPEIKHAFGQPWFVGATLYTWAQSKKVDTATIRLIGAEASTYAFRWITFMNRNPYTYLGTRPLKLVRDSDLASGLAMVASRETALGVLAGIAGSALIGGLGLTRFPGVVRVGGVSEQLIASSTPVPFQMDGEFMGTTTRLTVERHPGALSVLVPARRRRG
jgi:diacylglycerol kinase family enzyme